LILIFSLFIRSGDDDQKMAGYIDNDDDLDLADDDDNATQQTTRVRSFVSLITVENLALLNTVEPIGIHHSTSYSSHSLEQIRGRGSAYTSSQTHSHVVDPSRGALLPVLPLGCLRAHLLEPKQQRLPASGPHAPVFLKPRSCPE
jgi:hypothetical protein